MMEKLSVLPLPPVPRELQGPEMGRGPAVSPGRLQGPAAFTSTSRPLQPGGPRPLNSSHGLAKQVTLQLPRAGLAAVGVGDTVCRETNVFVKGWRM